MKKIIILIVLLALMVTPALAGRKTANNLFYIPDYSEHGPASYSLYAATLDATDAALAAQFGILTASTVSLQSQISALSTLLTNWAPHENQDILVPGCTYASATNFTVSGDLTSQFVANAKVRVDLGSGTLKGSYVASSSFGSGTTTVVLHDSILTSPLSGVWVTATRNGLFPYGGGYVNALDYCGGAPSGAGLSAALTAIGSSNQKTLLIASGSWPVAKNTVIPANITTKFEAGASFDLTGLLDAPIEALTQASACQVTITGHGLSTGDYVKFYGLLQAYVSDGTHSATHNNEWMNLNDKIYQITKVDNDHFTIPLNTSSYHAYVAATDPGRLCVPLQILGRLEAGKSKIFNISAPAQVCFANTYYANQPVNDPRQQREVYPEWFGAVGNGTANDLLALDACYHALKYADKAVGHILLSNFYGALGTWSLNENALSSICHLYVTGVGRNESGIVGLVPSAGTGCDGKPVIECIGSGNMRFKGFGIYGTSVATYSTQPPGAPSVGLLLGASQTTINTAEINSDDIYYYGWFKRGSMMNRGCAQSSHTNQETYITAWYDGVTPTYVFDYFVGAGDRPLIWSDLVPTNDNWNTWSSNRDVGACYYTIVKTVTYGTYATQSACIYQDKAAPILEGVFWGGQPRSYGVYSCNAGAFVSNSGGDGYGSVANIYLCSDSSGTSYPNCTVEAIIKDVSGSLAGGCALMTDAYTTLINSSITNIKGNNGYTIQLGAGFKYGRIENLWNNLTSFPIAGAVVGSHIEVPESCTFFNAPLADGYTDSILRRGPHGYGGDEAIITGDLRLGMPGGTTPNLYQGIYKTTFASAAPTTGSWPEGSFVRNSWLSTTGIWGWGCITSPGGTFGTLNSGATTGSITTGTKTLTLSSVSGLHIGDFINVVADGGGNAVSAGYVVNLDVTNKIAYLAANATATATNTAVSFNGPPTFLTLQVLPRTSGVTAAITTGTTVTHGLGLTPTKVLLTSVDGVPTGIYPGSLGGTTFAINFAGGGSHAFYWEAIQ